MRTIPAAEDRGGSAKGAQAGNWQAFPGRELASVPGRDCKHAKAGHAHCASSVDLESVESYALNRVMAVR